jgi:hypothetical protein
VRHVARLRDAVPGVACDELSAGFNYHFPGGSAADDPSPGSRRLASCADQRDMAMKVTTTMASGRTKRGTVRVTIAIEG